MNAIIGKVTNPESKAPETDALVELLSPTNPAQRMYSTNVDMEGEYKLQEIIPGSYLLFSAVWGSGKRYCWEIPFTIKADETININLLADTAQTLE